MSFTALGKQFPSWKAGQYWGLWLYQSGYDQRVLFTIRQFKERLRVTKGPPSVIGPNAVLVSRSKPIFQPTDSSINSTTKQTKQKKTGMLYSPGATIQSKKEGSLQLQATPLDIDHSKTVRDSMAKSKKGLEKEKKERTQNQG